MAPAVVMAIAFPHLGLFFQYFSCFFYLRAVGLCGVWRWLANGPPTAAAIGGGEGHGVAPPLAFPLFSFGPFRSWWIFSIHFSRSLLFIYSLPLLNSKHFPVFLSLSRSLDLAGAVGGAAGGRRTYMLVFF
jgi:hypothetical protein